MPVSVWINIVSHPIPKLADPSFRAQGASQAFEDAGVLGAIFSQSVGRDQIPDALRVFEEVRKPRASDVRHRTLEQKAMFALAHGPAQEERNAKLRAGADYELFQWLWGYDATKSGREAWKRFESRPVKTESKSTMVSERQVVNDWCKQLVGL